MESCSRHWSEMFFIKSSLWRHCASVFC